MRLPSVSFVVLKRLFLVLTLETAFFCGNENRSSEVIAWFQEASEDAARQCAASESEHLRRQDLDRAGQLPLRLNTGPDHAA